MAERVTKKVRCAVYTRVSTDEGLNQSFNSLDAQREACSAFILSQQHEGWVAAAQQYDDGGFSGGTMDRPALIRLLADIRAGEIDTIVVYKIDRLTRSLADFARIVDVLDACGASFVSVTQSFNTQTSMGRLTLNVLLSFAQFERELTGERIRDKIAASKARGMWMGGVVPLGYDVRDRKLVVNQAEAETVRHIYRRYLAVGSVLVLQAELQKQGFTSKATTASAGSTFSRGALYLLLQNRLYLGQICHKGTPYPGKHEAIVPLDLFEQAQTQLERNRVERSTAATGEGGNLLTGLLWDRCGRPMTPNHSVKAKVKRYRYYVSRRAVGSTDPVWRVPAGDLEEAVVGSLRSFLSDSHAIFENARLDGADAATVQQTISGCSTIADGLGSKAAAERRSALSRCVRRVAVYEDHIELRISTEQALGGGARPKARTIETTLQIPAQIARVGKQVRMIVSREGRPSCDPALVKLIVKAWQARGAVERSDATVASLAHELGYDRQYFGVLLRLSYLSPAIIEAILSGQQPLALNRQSLARAGKLPTHWNAQQESLGFA